MRMSPVREAVPAVVGAALGATGKQPIRPKDAFDKCSALIAQMPTLDTPLKHKLSWSIQEALDQHASLTKHKQVLAEIGQNRIQVRQTQLSFAELEVDEALAMAKSHNKKSPHGEDDDLASTASLAAHIREVTNDLKLASRLLKLEESVVQNRLALAEVEVEKSRQEMKRLKDAIDDPALSTDPTRPVCAASRRVFYCCNCKVGGHGQRFSEYLLERPDWEVFPEQKWFTDEKSGQFYCPLGKKVVDFTDETQFSRYSMYIKGRIWLEEKTRMWDLVPELMPPTYVIRDQKWDGRMPPECESGAPAVLESDVMPWFVKEADRNWGTSVRCCQYAHECMSLAEPGATYVVQKHIPNPLCMDDGRKAHIKFYVLLIGEPMGISWSVYSFSEGYLSISPNAWSPKDCSKETQVTIIRTQRIGSWRHWKPVYPVCQKAVGTVIQKAVEQNKLEGRVQKQFEILSADFILDNDMNAYMLEFNMSPVLKDPKDSPDVHDADMIRGGLSIVFPWEGGDPDKWDLICEIPGKGLPDDKAPAPAPAAPAAAPAGAAEPSESQAIQQSPVRGREPANPASDAEVQPSIDADTGTDRAKAQAKAAGSEAEEAVAAPHGP